MSHNMRRSMRPSMGRKSFRNHQDYEPHYERQILIPINPPTKQQPFNPEQYIVAEFSKKEIEKCKYIFDFIDGDSDGKLTPLDFRKVISDNQAMRFAGYNPERLFIYKQMMSEFDKDQRGQISFREFVKMMSTRLSDEDQTQDIRKVFEAIDVDTKGYITHQDIKQLNCYLTDELSSEQINLMIKSCDPKSDGVITWQAFLAFNKRRNF